MSRCLADGCAVDMSGQMVVCAPHWTFLSRDLQREIIAAHNLLAAQQKAGNPRRATRDAWRALLPRITAELTAARAELERRVGRGLPSDGVAWRRASLALERRLATTTA